VTKHDFDPGAAALGDGVFGLPHGEDDARVVLIPVPWEPTTSYRKGTAKGPAAILHASKQVELYDADFGRPYEHGIAMLAPDPEIVAWNALACSAAEPVIAVGGEVDGNAELEASLELVNELSARLNARVHALTASHLAKDKIVGVIGGDHAAPFGAIAAHAAKYPGLGVLHIDAHADLRDAYEGFHDSHASILFNVAERLPDVAKIVQVGIRDFSEEELERIVRSRGRIETFFDRAIARASLRGKPFSKMAKKIARALPKQVYVTFDIDGLDPSLCPHTGTPVPGGLSYREICELFVTLAEQGKEIVGFDLNEVAPGPEGDEWDANVGARVLYKLIGLALATSRPAAQAT
jgi:agmatinase